MRVLSNSSCCCSAALKRKGLFKVSICARVNVQLCIKFPYLIPVRVFLKWRHNLWPWHTGCHCPCPEGMFSIYDLSYNWCALDALPGRRREKRVSVSAVKSLNFVQLGGMNFIAIVLHELGLKTTYSHCGIQMKRDKANGPMGLFKEWIMVHKWDGLE